MANEVIHEDKIKKPTLTMKFLYELIRHNQYENYKLSLRVEQLEQQLEELHKPRAEAAAAAVHPIIDEPEDKGLEMQQSLISPVSLTPRSQRHPSPNKRKSIWTSWFRPHSL